MLAATVVVLFAFACASPPLGRADLLDFLQLGTTRRTDVQLRLGEPNASFEGERILAYRLGRDDGGYMLVKGGAGWSRVRFNLMLAFDELGVLQRYTLVEIETQ